MTYDSYVVYNSDMQLANSATSEPLLRRHVRKATRQDAAAIQRLMKMGVYIHVHTDWRAPGAWLDRPGFVVFDEGDPDESHARKSEIAACLAIAAEPPPAAWVRIAAIDSTAGYSRTAAMFDAILDNLDPNINEIAWFLTDYWPLHWLERLGFAPSSEVLTYHRQGVSVPPLAAPTDLVIRPLLMDDIPALAAIEEAAFEPRWRHSAEDLMLAWRHSICFTVALRESAPVAFQFSTGSAGNAHLSRMTVHPSQQGMGIGAALLADALDNYRLQNIRAVTLNTQADNSPSRRLYERFGFELTGASYPVWSYYPDAVAGKTDNHAE